MHPSGIPIEPDDLSASELFAELDGRDLAGLAAQGWVLELGRGERVLSRGDRLDCLLSVLDGRLKLYMLSCSGDERVLRVLQSGDTFGEAIMFNQIPSPVFVDTLSATRLACLPRNSVVDALTSQPDFAATMLRNMSGLMAALIQDLETACLQNALQRTVNYLLRQALHSPPPHVALTLPAPKTVIASTLNLSAETFSRELHRLQDHGYVEINRRVIYLRDRAGLKRLADGGRLG